MTQRQPRRVNIFSCGSQYADWIYNNCDACPQTYDETLQNWRCPLMRAIDMAYILDGTVSYWIAKAIGFYDNRSSYIWHCERRKKIDPKTK